MQDIYTDGSCIGNPGPGGWGVVGPGMRVSGGQDNTTNNAMELTAAVKALEQCIARNILEITLFTDSTYVRNGITSWIKNWKRNDWRIKSGEPVKNKELWIQIDTLIQRMNLVEWRWVKAHNGHPQNELVDSIAYQEALEIKNAKSAGKATTTRALSLKSNKFYGVVKGHVPGIYTTWDEAKAQVHGYKDAMYKSFKTEAEAKEYMNTPPPNDRIYLDVPYQEKDVVKSQDARWDPGKKKWWVRDITPELEKYVCVK
jgi:ribonuclease HI|tara:strand:- start:6508 stop:7278 length:771 start_codon:yes stop_codon:yes gene_type:complete